MASSTVSDPVVIVSGGGRGIGRAVADRLLRAGAQVVVARRSVGGARRSDAGRAPREFAIDVTDQADVESLVERVVTEFGRIDGLVCSANPRQPSFAELDALPWTDFIDKVSAELAAVYHLTRAVLPVIASRPDGGAIVILSSSAAEQVGPGRLAHGTSKAAVNALAGHLAAFGARRGVAVTTIAPGVVDTDATAGVLTAELRTELADHSVLGRVTTPDDIAALVEFALSPAARVSPGQFIRADGGRLLIDGRP